MKKHKLRTALCVILVGTVLAAFVAIATETGSQTTAQPGSQGDPLVTLSYLNETFFKQIMDSLGEKIGTRNDTLLSDLEEKINQTERDILTELGGSFGDETGGTAVSFTCVTLAPGQILYGGVGCEVILRSGSAICVSEGNSTPGLLDTTDASSINHNSALKENHLYIMPELRGIFAESEIVVLIRGEYMIG